MDSKEKAVSAEKKAAVAAFQFSFSGTATAARNVSQPWRISSTLAAPSEGEAPSAAFEALSLGPTPAFSMPDFQLAARDEALAPAPQTRAAAPAVAGRPTPQSRHVRGKRFLHKALETAVQENDTDLLDLLLTTGLGLNDVVSFSVDREGTPLWYACTASSVVVAQHLLRLGADVNLPGRVGSSPRTPLWTSVLQANTDLCRTLLERGADADFRDDLGNTSLLMALRLQNEEIVDFLLQPGRADVNLSNVAGETPLLRAVGTGRAELVSRVLAAPGVLVNKLLRQGHTVLYRAVSQNREAIVRLLLKAGAGDAASK